MIRNGDKITVHTPPVSQKARARARSPLAVGIDLRALADQPLRGLTRYTLEITNALAARSGLAVTGFTDTALVHETSIRTLRYEGNSEVIREQWHLARLLAREQIDVFLCPANRGLPFAAPCPTVLTLHDAVEWDRSLVVPARGKARLRFVYSSISSLAGASLILAVSQASADSITARLGIAPRRIRCVYEAASHRFSPEPRPDDAFYQRGLGVEVGYILYVGGFDRKKDLPTSIRAVTHLADLPEVSLVIAGQRTPDADSLARVACDLGISDRVRFLGYVPDQALPALYRGAACFAFPAVAEGFGLPVVEAMACGVPVVAAAAGSLPEVVGAGGLLTRPGDPVELSAKLRALLRDEAARQRWAEAATRRAAAFSWSRSAAQTEDVLRQAAAEGAARAWVGRLTRLPGTLTRSVQAEFRPSRPPDSGVVDA